MANKSERIIEIDSVPLVGIDEPNKTVIHCIAKIMLTLHYPEIEPDSWKIEEDNKYYTIVMSFPQKTWFDDDQTNLIRQVNEYRIARVWIQPENNAVLLCVNIRKSNVDDEITITEVRIITTRISNPSKKRKRIEMDETNLPSYEKKNHL